jgi:hypothetical protein
LGIPAITTGEGRTNASNALDPSLREGLYGKENAVDDSILEVSNGLDVMSAYVLLTESCEDDE